MGIYLVSLLLFFVMCVLSFYIPGTVVLTLLKFKLSKYEHFFISWILGISIFLITSYVLSWLNLVVLQYAVMGTFAAAFIVLFRKNRIKLKFKFSKTEYITGGIILLGSVLYTALTFFSGWKTHEGLQFTGVNDADGLVHVARIKNFSYFFPPHHPGLAGIEFKGYHYFYDFLLSQFHVLFKFDVYDLYFRHFSLFISLLFGAGFLFAARILRFSFISQIMVLILAYLTPGFSRIVGDIIHADITLSMLSVSNVIFDPSMVIALPMIIGGLFLLPNTLKSYKYAIVVGVILGVVSQIKVYAGLVSIIVLALYGLYIVIKTKNIFQNSYYVAALLTGILTAVTFLPNNFGSGSFIWAPFLTYEHFMRQVAFSESYWEVKRRIFLEHNNIPRLVIMYGQAIGLFLTLALGPRIVTFMLAPKMLTKKFWKNDFNIIFLAAIIPAFAIPTFFIQSVSVFDIGQFFAVGILLLNIPTAYVIGRLFVFNKIIGLAVILLTVSMALYEFGIVERQYLFTHHPVTVTDEQLVMFGKISGTLSPDEFIVSIPNSSKSEGVVNLHWYKPSLVSAMTGRSVYLEDEIIKNPKLERQIMRRENDIKTIADAISTCDIAKIKSKMESIDSNFLLAQQPSRCLKAISKSSNESSSLSFYKF